MAGLLNIAGRALAGGLAAGAKGYADTLTEQTKQQALFMREENMQRIQQIYAKENQKASQVFTAGENKLARDAAAVNTNKTIKSQETTALIKEVMDSDRAESAKDLTIRLADKKIEVDKATRAQAVTDANALATFEHNLKKKDTGTIYKNYQDLAMIFPPEEAKAMVKTMASKEATDLERIKLNSWSSIYVASLKALTADGMPLTPDKKQAAIEETSQIFGGWMPSDIGGINSKERPLIKKKTSSEELADMRRRSKATY
jgi:hypothetical protein